MFLSIMEDFESIHISDLFEVSLNFTVHFFSSSLCAENEILNGIQPWKRVAV